MALQGICTPALIYIVFSLAQIVLDAAQGLFNTAFVKFWISIIITVLLNYLCQSGLTIISWIIVFVPFMLMTVITSILLLGLGLDPYKGKLKVTGDGESDRSKFDIRQKYMDIYKNKKSDTKNTKITGADIQNNGIASVTKTDSTTFASYPKCTEEKILKDPVMKDKCQAVVDYNPDSKSSQTKEEKKTEGQILV